MNESTNQSFISFQRTKTDSSKSARKSQSLSELPDTDKKFVISDPVCVQQLHCWTRTRNSAIKGLYFIVIVSTLLSFPTSVACFRELWACTRENYGQSGKCSEVGMVSGEVRKPFFQDDMKWWLRFLILHPWFWIYPGRVVLDDWVAWWSIL